MWVTGAPLIAGRQQNRECYGRSWLGHPLCQPNKNEEEEEGEEEEERKMMLFEQRPRGRGHLH